MKNTINRTQHPNTTEQAFAMLPPELQRQVVEAIMNRNRLDVYYDGRTIPLREAEAIASADLFFEFNPASPFFASLPSYNRIYDNVKKRFEVDYLDMTIAEERNALDSEEAKELESFIETANRKWKQKTDTKPEHLKQLFINWNNEPSYEQYKIQVNMVVDLIKRGQTLSSFGEWLYAKDYEIMTYDDVKLFVEFYNRATNKQSYDLQLNNVTYKTAMKWLDNHRPTLGDCVRTFKLNSCMVIANCAYVFDFMYETHAMQTMGISILTPFLDRKIKYWEVDKNGTVIIELESLESGDHLQEGEIILTNEDDEAIIKAVRPWGYYVAYTDGSEGTVVFDHVKTVID